MTHPSLPVNRLWAQDEIDVYWQDYDIWEVRFLGYMALQGLKETILPSNTTVGSTKNEKAYAELVMLLDEKLLSMIMTDAIDDGRKALEMLRDHYKGIGKPRILTLYNNLCNMKYISDQGLTDYISRAEILASSLKNANETVSDSLLISMVLKGLPVSYNSFIVVITQSAKDYSFVKFKSAIRNFNENEKSRITTATLSNHVSNRDSVMKYTTLKSSKRVVQCYDCKKEGHYTQSCPNMYCSFCKIKGHTIDKCRKKDTSNNSSVKVDSAKGATGCNDDTYAFKAVSWNKQSNYS